jgi:hypothetical protein
MRDTRYIIAEQAQRIISGGATTNDTEIRLEELVIYVDQAFGQFIKIAYFENKEDGQSYVDGSFIYTFYVDVKEDPMRKKLFAKIPSTYVNLPSGVGIYSVSPIEDEFSSYVPLNPNFMALSKGLEVGKLETRKGYFVENTRMFLYNVTTLDCPEKLIVKLVGGIQGDDEIEVDLPLNMQSELVNLTVQLYTQQQANPKDELNDNTKA